MKKYLLASFFLVTSAAIYSFAPNYGAETTNADGYHAVGIIVKNGAQIETILAQFTVAELPCDPNATTTPQDLCTFVTKDDQPVHVFYTAADNMQGKQGFKNKLGAFPFTGSIDYVNRRDEDIEPRLIQFMLEQGAETYEIIRE